MTLHTKTIEQLHEMLVNKEIKVVDLVEATFNRIDEVEGEVGAFVSYDKERSLLEAKEIDARGLDENNVLDGIPISVKDNIVTKDFKTTAASKMLEDFVSIYDATVVEKLKAAGMIVIGKVNMDEFAMGGTTETSKLQTTRNPYDLNRVPGGSSGGSAVVVAAGMTPASLGTDTGGSVRQPAAYNNVVGIKPTYGSISRYGVISFASSLDQVGPLTRTVKDNAIMMNALSGKDQRDGTSADIELDFTEKIGQDIKGLKIGIPKEFFNDQVVDAEVIQVIEEGIEQLKELGAEIVEVTLPNMKYGVPAYYAISSAEVSSNLQRFDGVRYGYRSEKANSLDELYVNSRSEGFGDEVKRRIVLGGIALSTEYYDAFYGKATKARTILKKEFAEVLKQVDVILGPSSVSIAPKIGDQGELDPAQAYYGDILTVPANLTGLPSLNIPAGFVREMPVGLSLIGDYFEEATLYQVAYAFEQETEYYKTEPSFEGGAE